MNSSKQRKLGSILGYIYTAVHSIISIIYIPILLNGIGDGEYGLYQMMGSVIAYFAVMETPLSSSILRYYSYYKERADSINMQNTLAIGRRVFRILSFAFIVTIFPLTALIQAIYSKSLSSNELNEASIMLAVMIINIVISANNYIYIAAINANEKYVFLKLTSIIQVVIQPLAVILIIQQHPYALSIVVVQTVLNLILCIVRWYYAKFVLKTIVKYHKKDTQLLRKILALSLSILFIAIADQIFWKTDQLILGAMKDTSAVAVYSIGAQFNTMFISVGCVLSGVVLPLITRTEKDDPDNTKLTSLFSKFGRYQSYLVFLMLSGVFLFGKEFVLIISGEQYLDAYYVALLLMIPYSVDLIQNSGCIILQVKDKFYIRSIILFLMALVNIALTIILVKRIGMLGAALATTITIILGSGITMNIIYHKLLNLKICQFWKESLPILIGAIISTIIGCGTKLFSFPNIYVSFIIHVVSYTLIYSFIMWFFVMNQNEKNMIKGITKKTIQET